MNEKTDFKHEHCLACDVLLTSLGTRPTFSTKKDVTIIIIIIIIMYICHALINAMSAHMIRVNLNMIFYTSIVLPKQFT